MKKKLFASLLAAAMVASLAACGGSASGGSDSGAGSSSADTTETKEEKTQLVAIDSEWYGLDSFQLDGTAGGQGFNSTPPFAWDAENSCIVDNVCTDWTVAEDGSKITFNVPEGLKFSTGEDLLPEDVKASIEHGLAVSPYCDGYANISSIDIDGQQITLNLDHFSSDIEYYFSTDFIIIIDKDELDTMSDEDLMWGCHPYGPYYLDEGGYVSGSEITLTRYDGYKCFNPLIENKGAWSFETVKFRFNVEDFTESEEIKNGTIDMIMSLSMDQVLELQNEEDIVIEEAAYPCINYLELNNDTPCFQDINVRKAFMLSLDREKVADIVEGSVVPAYSMIYDSMQCFSQEAKDYFKENYANDKEEAIRLLEEAGWTEINGDGYRVKDGEVLEFTAYSWNSYSTIMEAFAAQAAEVGFKMNIEFLEWNYIYDNIESDSYDAGTCGLAWAEPILILGCCYYDFNAPGNDDTYAELVAETGKEPDPEARIDKVRDAQLYMFENCTMVPMFGDNGWTAFTNGLTGYHVNKDGTITMADMHF